MVCVLVRRVLSHNNGLVQRSGQMLGLSTDSQVSASAQPPVFAGVRVVGCTIPCSCDLGFPTTVHACKKCVCGHRCVKRQVGSEQRSQGASRLVGTRVLQKALGGVGWAASVRSLVRFFIHDCAASSSSLGSEGRSRKRRPK